LVLTAPPLLAQTAGIEWEALNQEVMDLYRAGKYGRAVVVAKKALEVAEKNVGPDHPDVATSLENLAALYRATKRDAKALALEKQAAKIRGIK
jgi:tetratricopeptide (TPR) repeat protein